MINFWVISVLLSALAGWWVGDTFARATVKDLRADIAQMESDQAQASAAAVVTAAQGTAQHQRRKDDALEKAARRADALLADNRALHTELARLRSEIDRVPGRIRAASHAAVAEYAATATDVFDQCVRAYRDLATQADGHATDVRTLIDAWPRNPHADSAR